MNKKRILMLVVPVLLIITGGVAAQTEMILFQNLHSTIVRSENNKYVFALVPEQSVDEYVEHSKADWRRGGYSEQEVRQKEEQLAGLIEKEREIRRKYSASGLYEVSSGNRLRSIDNFPKEIDSIFVANDGSYVVGFNGDITTFHVAPDASIDEILNTTDQLAIHVVPLTDPNIEKVCSVRIPRVKIADSVNRRSGSLYWADRERSVLLSEEGLLRIGKLNGDEILFDVRQCEILRGKRGESESRLTMVSLSSRANELLILTGEVKEIAITEEDTNTIKLRIGLDLTLRNISESNIIVYKSDFALLNLILFYIG